MKLSISMSTESKMCSCNWEARKLRERPQSMMHRMPRIISLSLSLSLSLSVHHYSSENKNPNWSRGLQFFPAIGLWKRNQPRDLSRSRRKSQLVVVQSFSVRRNSSFKYSRRGSLGACRSTTAKFLPAEKSARPVSSRLLQQQPKSGISVLGKKLFPSDQEETQEFFASTERA